MPERAPWYNLVEPPRLVEHFVAHPPEGFRTWTLADGTPAFSAPLDPLLTADAGLKRFANALPGSRRWRRRLRLRTCFVGTTVSEYGLLSRATGAEAFVRNLFAGPMLAEARAHTLVVVKDLPVASPLVDAASNAHAGSLSEALRAAGFALLAGQALAWVPVDFATSDEFVARLSASRRKDIRRKLRSRSDVAVEVLPTGAAAFDDSQLLRRVYALYRNVYEQSEMRFDLLSRAFFDAVLRDPHVDGRVFLYRHEGALIGFNLCVVANGALVDKYIGFEYPQAREHNLYCMSWMQNLDYAAANGLTRFIAGLSDPQVKAHLGARFTFTRHAVYSRHALLRALLGRVGGRFEADRTWQREHARASGRS